MDTVIEKQQKSDPELRLLTEWGTTAPARWRESATVSVAAHIGLVILLVSLPRGVFQTPKRMLQTHKVTPLVAPPFELTQPDPNNGKISKSVNMESLMPRPSIQLPRSAPSTTRPAAQTPAPRPAPFVAPPAPAPKAVPAPQIPEPPEIETALNEGALSKGPIGLPQAPPAPPQIQAEEKPKLAFETPGAEFSSPRQGTGRLAVPSASVSEAVRCSHKIVSPAVSNKLVPFAMEVCTIKVTFAILLGVDVNISLRFGQPVPQPRFARRGNTRDKQIPRHHTS